MKIEFVNHSSFIVEYKDTRIICDPWLEGSVFNNGWSLISESKFTYDDFANINYIWFSHEHPDHFFPPNIKKIPPQYREKITVLFQHTKDKRVLNFCKKLEFKNVIELYPNQWFKAGSIDLLCEHFQEGDSWICFKTPDLTYLNTNDCGIVNKHEAIKILNKVKKVDLLFSQFSYAYWVGNPEDTELRFAMALEKLARFKFQCDIFKPQITIPIASYIYFSHIENNWLNDNVNTPRKTYDYLKKNTSTEPVILYVGEEYDFGAKHDSESSITKYQKDFDRITNVNLYSKTETVDLADIQKAASSFIKDLNEENSALLKRKLVPSYIYISDYKEAFRLSLHGFEKLNKTESTCDVSLTSENLLFCFQHPYGLDTTQINGRMLKPKEGKYVNFYNFFRVNQLKSRGINPNSIKYLLGVLVRKILIKTGLQKN